MQQISTFENSLYKTLNKFLDWRYKENNKRQRDMRKLRRTTGDPWNTLFIDDSLTEFLRWIAEKKVSKR